MVAQLEGRGQVSRYSSALGSRLRAEQCHWRRHGGASGLKGQIPGQGPLWGGGHSCTLLPSCMLFCQGGLCGASSCEVLRGQCQTRPRRLLLLSGCPCDSSPKPMCAPSCASVFWGLMAGRQDKARALGVLRVLSMVSNCSVCALDLCINHPSLRVVGSLQRPRWGPHASCWPCARCGLAPPQQFKAPSGDWGDVGKQVSNLCMTGPGYLGLKGFVIILSLALVFNNHGSSSSRNKQDTAEREVRGFPGRHCLQAQAGPRAGGPIELSWPCQVVLSH